MLAANHALLPRLRRRAARSIRPMPDLSKEQWQTHYGPETWALCRRQAQVDPNNVLTPGQELF